MKKAKIEFKLEQEMYEDFKEHCNKNGYNMSKKLRLFIKNEISKKYKEVKINEVKIKPENEIEKVKIMGKEYLSIKKSPNIFVVKADSLTDDKNIMFNLNNVNYKLEDCIYDKKENYHIIECKYWEMNYIG